MKSNNICKFIIPERSQELAVSCFILETDPAIMQEKTLLKTHKMILITQGEGACFFGTSKTEFAPGYLLFGFKGEFFQVEPKTDCEYMYLNFDKERADIFLRRFNIHKNNRCFLGFDGLVPLWRESLSRANQQTIDLASESILLYTFSRLTSAPTPRDTLFCKIVETLEKRFQDPELSVGWIARDLSYNPKYISRLFKEQMGVGFSEYLRTMRIKYAISLLDHGIDSVKNVALLSGFNDPLYFSTVFKKSVGVSPTEYIHARTQRENGEFDIDCMQ